MEIITFLRELVSSLLFNIAMGQSYYYDASIFPSIFAILLYISFAWIILKKISFPNRLNIYAALVLGLIVAFASVRYMPFGGDARIYCDYMSINLSGANVYLVDQKYAFNYPPFFIAILTQFCKYNYMEAYPIVYSLLIGLTTFVLSKEYKIDLLTVGTILTTSFLGFRWILKTGNFLFWEIIFLLLALVFAKKNANLTLILLVLFGFQRLWFFLVPLLWFKVAKKKINYIGLGGSTLVLFSLLAIKFELLNSYINQLLNGNTISSVWNGEANHNSPSLLLNVVDLFNLHSSFLICFIVYSAIIIFYINKSLNKSIFNQRQYLLSQIIFLVVALNPTFKPYYAILAVIALVPLISLLKVNYVGHYIFVYCFLINIFWIIGSLVPMGYPYSIFQIVFILSTIKIMFNNESYVKDD